MDLCPGPSPEWAESETEASLLLRACEGTCQQMLQREERLEENCKK